MPPVKLPPHGESNKAHPMFGFAPEDGLPVLNIPNLDGMNDCELGKLSRALAELLRYISHTRRAHKARTAGRIPDAINHENKMELLYRELPESWRW